jgi:predicted alpha/beta-hydrolase family hydrolase
LILGHGAGAGQSSNFMVSFAGALAARGIDTVTFNFLYMEQGRRLPDPKDKLEACYRAVIETVARRRRGRLAIGGKSMGGRIATQVAAAGAPEVAGLVLLGYPLHPPGKKDQLRAKHLAQIKAPMLFVQGSRDVFGTPPELAPIINKLPAAAELFEVAGGDHSFKVLKRDGGNQEETYKAIQDRIDQWLRATLSP